MATTQQKNTPYGSARVYDPLAKLIGSDKPSTISFPDDVDNMPYSCLFRVLKYEFDRNEVMEKREDTIQHLHLPMPANLGTSYSAKHGGVELGAMGKEMGKVAVDSIDTLLKSGTLGTKIRDLAGQLESFRSKLAAGGTDALTNLMAEAAEKDLPTMLGLATGGPLGGIVASVAERTFLAGLAAKGVARNPHMAILFQGPDFRTHQFQYKLIAKSDEESKALREIIHAFKYYMLPNYQQHDHWFTYPEQFDIEFVRPYEDGNDSTNQFLFNIGPSVLTGFEVNYHGEGTPAYFEKTGAPVSVTISLSFLETTLTTKREVQQYNR